MYIQPENLHNIRTLALLRWMPLCFSGVVCQFIVANRLLMALWSARAFARIRRGRGEQSLANRKLRTSLLGIYYALPGYNKTI